jgi:hypothetical protein
MGLLHSLLRAQSLPIIPFSSLDSHGSKELDNSFSITVYRTAGEIPSSDWMIS